MVDLQSVGEQQMLRSNHVLVVIVREVRVHAVAGLARSTVTDSVGQNDVVLRRVEQLSWPEQIPGELLAYELLSGAGRAVQDQHCIHNTSVSVELRLAVSREVELQLRKRFAI